MSKRPNLKHFPESPQHVEEVYSYYAGREPSPRLAKFALKACGVLLRPKVTHSDAEGLTRHLDNGGVVVIAGNHHKGHDPFVFAGAVGFDPVLRKLEEPIPRTRILAKRSLFLGPASPVFRPFIENVAAIPVARQRDSDTEVGKLSRQKAIDTSINFLVSGANVMLYPEETRRDVYSPDKSKNGVGRIAVGAAAEIVNAEDETLPSSVKILPIGVSYSDNWLMQKIGLGAHVHVGQLIDVAPDAEPGEIHQQTMDAVGEALDFANAA